MNGLIHIYTGDGKGKTTAALGLAARACGASLCVCLVQFMKGENTAELKSLESLGIAVHREAFTGFIGAMDDAQRAQCIGRQRALFERVPALMDACDMLILDEVMALLHCGAVSAAQIAALLDAKPAPLELVLTGRAAPEALIERAHYVTEMRCVKHPFDQCGAEARHGVEF